MKSGLKALGRGLKLTWRIIEQSRTLRNLLFGMKIFLGIDDDSFANQGPSEGDAWPAQYLTEHEARSIIMSCPAFWVDEAPIGAGVRSDASASSHSESHSVTISTHRSRVLDRPYGDSRSTIVHSSSGGAAPVDSRAAEALAVLWSCFNVDSIMTTRRLVEVRKHYYIPLEYELHVPLPGEHPYNAFPSGFSLSTDALETGLRFPLHPVIEACLEGWQISPSQMAPNSWRYLVAFLWECYGFLIEWTSWTVNNSVPVLTANEAELVEILRGILSASKGVKDMNEAWLAERVAPSTTSVSVTIDVVGSMAEKRPIVSEGEIMRKHSRKVTFEQPAGASGSTTRTLAEKGKGSVEIEEAPEWGYTIQELCEVEDRAGADKFFTSIMMQLKTVKGEDLLVPRWSAISGLSQVWTECPLSGEYLWGALHLALAKQVYKCSS
ncbi:hypothetical protein GW17_00060268 [Ensete ventricosum]|nr:hypothetical protein GW17_00060268 [Ensete ventricosum]